MLFPRTAMRRGPGTGARTLHSTRSLSPAAKSNASCTWYATTYVVVCMRGLFACSPRLSFVTGCVLVGCFDALACIHHHFYQPPHTAGSISFYMHAFPFLQHWHTCIRIHLLHLCIHSFYSSPACMRAYPKEKSQVQGIRRAENKQQALHRITPHCTAPHAPYTYTPGHRALSYSP